MFRHTEVKGAACVYSPDNIEAIAEAMNKIVNDIKLRTQLIENGKQRAQYFSWG